MRTIARQQVSQIAPASGRSSTLSQPAHGGARNVRTTQFAAADHSTTRTWMCKAAASGCSMACDVMSIGW
jgi:hypothetical protein